MISLASFGTPVNPEILLDALLASFRWSLPSMEVISSVVDEISALAISDEFSSYISVSLPDMICDVPLLSEQQDS